MPPECFGRVEDLRQFGLAQRRVDLIVTDLMDQNGFTTFTASQPRDQVMATLSRLRRDRAQTERTNRICHRWPFCGPKLQRPNDTSRSKKVNTDRPPKPLQDQVTIPIPINQNTGRTILKLCFAFFCWQEAII